MAEVLEALSEEEAYLYCILTDPTGIDLAEFCFIDEDKDKDKDDDDDCFRLWPFQWPWWRNQDPLQADQGSRSSGKTRSILLRAAAFPFCYPGNEMVIGAPELNHLTPITSLIERFYTSVRILKEMLPRGRNNGITHKPFQLESVNGARIMGRIPQITGKGFKGLHPLILELDEAQDIPEAAWMEVIETLKRGKKGAVWRVHGVTRGVRDQFYKLTQPHSGWKVHRSVAMARPNWTDEERQEKIKLYGSKDHPDYRRNVLGEHGDSTSPIFVLHRLMQCVDQDEQSEYNEHYHYVRVNAEILEETRSPIEMLMQLPVGHLDQYKKFWIGADIGYTIHPTEIVVMGETQALRKKGAQATRLDVIARFHLERVEHADQVAAILALIHHYRPEAFSMDSTGLGLPLWQDIQAKAEADPNIENALRRIRGYNFSSKIIVDIDSTKELDEDRGETPLKDAAVERNVLEYSTDVLRSLVDGLGLLIPWDRDLIGEMQGQTYTIVRSSIDGYGRKIYSKGKFHTLDALRMGALGWKQHAIEELIANERNRQNAPVMDVLMSY